MNRSMRQYLRHNAQSFCTCNSCTDFRRDMGIQAMALRLAGASGREVIDVLRSFNNMLKEFS